MSLFVYRQRASNSAMDLAEALDAIRFRGKTVPIQRKVKRGDLVVAWGEALPQMTGIRSLNGTVIRSKYQDALRLREANVPTIQVSLARPGAQAVGPAPVDPAVASYGQLLELADAFSSNQVPNVRGNRVLQTAATQLQAAVEAFTRSLTVPAPAAPRVAQVTWIGRRNNHVGGNDLLTPTTTPEYFVAKETFVKEFRIHSFLGKSIRAGVKALRDGFGLASAGRATESLASEWVRSWDGGWRIKYDGVSSKRKHREVAHAAVAALGLDFGAVDIGERADGTLCVLEVNRAPGLDGGTIDRYATAIQRWANGDTATDSE